MVHHLLTQWRIWNFMRSRVSDSQHASERRRWRNQFFLLQDSFCKNKKSDTTLPHVEKIVVRIRNKYCSSRSELVPTPSIRWHAVIQMLTYHCVLLPTIDAMWWRPTACCTLWVLDSIIGYELEISSTRDCYHTQYVWIYREENNLFVQYDTILCTKKGLAA